MNEKNLNQEAVPLNQSTKPRMERENIIVKVDEGDYKKAVDELRFSVIGRLFLHKGEIAPSTLELKERLQALWSIENLKVILLGRCVYHVLLHNMIDQSLVMDQGTTLTKPGMLRISRWYPDFNLNNHIQATTPLWVRFYDLPLEYRKEQTLFNIARGWRFHSKLILKLLVLIMVFL